MKYFEIDKTHFPVILIRINPIEMSLKDQQEYLEKVYELVEQFPGLVLITDISKGKPLSSEVRIYQGNWNKKHEAFLKQRLNGLVFVNESIIMTIVLKGIFLVQKPPVTHTVVTNLEDALQWALEKVQVPAKV